MESTNIDISVKKPDGEKRKNIEPNLRKKIRMHYSRVCAIARQKRKSLKLQISDGEMSQVIATDNISCR